MVVSFISVFVLVLFVARSVAEFAVVLFAVVSFVVGLFVELEASGLAVESVGVVFTAKVVFETSGDVVELVASIPFSALLLASFVVVVSFDVPVIFLAFTSEM